MRLPFAFRLSMYLTLGLACTSLAYSLVPHVPELAAFTGLVGVLLAVAFVLEGRWALTPAAANALGALIAAAAGVWVAFQLFPSGRRPGEVLGWSFAALVFKYLGPFLMLMLAVKLLRPKNAGDWWMFQAMGLIAVAMACDQGRDHGPLEDRLFTGLLMAYLVAGCWSLTLFYFHREGLPADPAPAGPRAARLPLLAPASGWLAAGLAVGAGAFALGPRVGDNRWEWSLPSARMETGFSAASPSIDLNNTGTVAINSDPAFEVVATAGSPDGEPYLDLPSDQRWRGAVLRYYARGRWDETPRYSLFTPPRPADLPRPPGPRPANSVVPLPSLAVPGSRLPDFGPGQFFLTFLPTAKLARPVLADPIVWRQGDLVPVMSISTGRPPQWIQMPDGSFQPLNQDLSRTRYRQVTVTTDEPGLSPAPRVEYGGLEALRQVEEVRYRQLGERLRVLTVGVLRQLVDAGRLPAEALEGVRPDAGRPREEHYEAIGRALEWHLAESGEYGYTLDLERQDTNLDPVEDFLVNVRRGHCNRFSTALALMLRSVEIPTQVVVGFRGCEPLGDGRYQVLQSQAHSWVEVLVRRPSRRPDVPAGTLDWYWLTLDPTPSSELAGQAAASWHERLWDAGWSFVRDNLAWLAVAAVSLAGLVVLRRKLARRAKAAPGARGAAARGYARLLAVLGRIGLAPKRGQTPLEFAQTAGERLRAMPPAAAHAGVPQAVVGEYYPVRYGGRPADAPAAVAAEERIGALELALRARPVPTNGDR
jgi:hypothetical protein